MLHRRQFLGLTAVGAAAALARPTLAAAEAPPEFELDEITLAQLQEGMRNGRFTAASLTRDYLARIDTVDKRGPAINALIELNPDAGSIAEELDRERAGGKTRGPLHGIP